MKISIVIPVYNVEKYIERCLRSVMSQTYKGAMECIVVDDCGKDRSVEIAERVIGEYIGDIDFIILHHDSNKGLSGARNTGTRKATGDYILYIDSDDAITDDCIALMAAKAEAYDDVDVIQGTTLTIPDDDVFYSIKKYEAHDCVADNIWIRKEFYRINDGLPVNAWNKLIRRAFITDNNLFFKEGIIHEDQHWMYFATKKMKSMAFVQQTTYLHYRNDESIMKSSGEEKSNCHWGVILQDIVDDMCNSRTWTNIDQLALWKYEIIMVSRYGDNVLYNGLYHRVLSLFDSHGNRMESLLLKLWHLFNNAFSRSVVRQYAKMQSRRLLHKASVRMFIF